MSAIVFFLLGSEHNFSTKWTKAEDGTIITPSFYNGLFSTIAFNLGALTSIASGFFGMKIATYANARVAVEARKGIAPAFEVGAYSFLKHPKSFNLHVRQHS
jgi:H+-translocating diphosphatase